MKLSNKQKDVIFSLKDYSLSYISCHHYENGVLSYIFWGRDGGFERLNKLMVTSLIKKQIIEKRSDISYPVYTGHEVTIFKLTEIGNQINVD